MQDIEKLIRGLECCIQSDRDCMCPEECPYHEDDETDDLCETLVKRDALEVLRELLKEQRKKAKVKKHWQAMCAECELTGTEKLEACQLCRDR